MKIRPIYLLFGIALTVFSFSSCEFQSFEEYEHQEYDGVFEWKKEIKNADWGNRYDFAATVFNGKMWLTGGYNPGIIKGDTYYEDVWSSSDGIEWEQNVEKAVWHGRRGHQLITFDDGSGEALFLIGGFEVDEETGYRQYTNDVWKSLDGENWTLIHERDVPPMDSLYTWYPRMEHSCIVKEIDGKSYIYLIAGRTMQEDFDGRFSTRYFNDVWRSGDGIEWERIDNNDFGVRSQLATTIDPTTGRMYLQGGQHGITIDPVPGTTHPVLQYEYLWYSDNGKDWIATNDTATMDQGLLWRSGHKIVHYQNSIWGLPGKNTSTLHYLFAGSQYYPIWKYDENGEWEVDSYGTDVEPRHGYEALVFNNKVWILGGYTSNSGQANDIWSGIIK